jgi:hypothetical protein
MDYKTVFQLKDDYTKKDLKTSFLKKVNTIRHNKEFNNIDKQFHIEQLNKLYLQGKNDLLKDKQLITIPNFFTPFNFNLLNFDSSNFIPLQQLNIENTSSSIRNTENTSSYYKSYSSRMGKDGIRYIEEESRTIKNGKAEPIIKKKYTVPSVPVLNK